MGVAYFVELDDAKVETDFVDGTSVARALDALNALAEEIGIAPLEAFMGQSVDECADVVEPRFERIQGHRGASWFDPHDGIAVVDALCAALHDDPARVDDAPEVLDDLVGYRQVLETAKRAGARWHLSVDI